MKRCLVLSVLLCLGLAGLIRFHLVAKEPAGQQSALGVATYANSITLTPGTVSIGVEDGCIEVHALTEDAARDLESGEMNRRACAMEGPP